MLDALLSARANRWRFLIGDLLSLAFCAFIAWKSWTFFHEAWADGKMSNTSWGPKLWPAYLLDGAGHDPAVAADLCVQIGDKHSRIVTASDEE